MSDRLRASVVVAVYNGMETITTCVASLLTLNYPRECYEIIVVDNGSTDGTLDCLRVFGPAVRIVHEEARGVSAARNTGIRAARADVIAVTDADVVVEPDWLSALVAALEDPAVGVAGGPMLSRKGGNRIEQFGEIIHDQRRAITHPRLPYVTTANWASRRDVLAKVGLFDETLPRGQDIDFAWRVLQAGYRLAYSPGAVVRHRNEHTLWGLVHEGYIHGLHGIRVSAKHRAWAPATRRLRRASLWRIGRDVRAIVSSGDRVNGMLALVFDTGKAAGEWVGLARRARG